MHNRRTTSTLATALLLSACDATCIYPTNALTTDAESTSVTSATTTPPATTDIDSASSTTTPTTTTSTSTGESSTTTGTAESSSGCISLCDPPPDHPPVPC